MQRKFIPGDEWLYYKFYTGYKTTDFLLSETIGPLSNRLIISGVISKWFFIRYTDPEHHLRWRVKLTHRKNIGDVMSSLHETILPYLESGQVSRVQTDTYKRELERYGTRTIELSETLFWHDSEMVTTMLAMIEGDEGEKLRWLFAMKSIDCLLSDFQYDTLQKHDLLRTLADNFGKEFNINNFLIQQLSDKYRDEKNNISIFMGEKEMNGNDYSSLYNLIHVRSDESRITVDETMETVNKFNEIPMNNLLGSYIHMMMNRVFQAKQRQHELVIYRFLYRYYQSFLKREQPGK